MGHYEHENLAKASLKVAVITFTDTRDKSSDKSGRIIIDSLEQSGHEVVDYLIQNENQDEMKVQISNLLHREKIHAIITNGGTGLSPRDSTIEVVRPIFDKELEGFGEIFRLLSFHQIGAAAILSRATAGVAKGKIVVCLPGSSKAVKLAMNRIVIPQLPHMVWEIGR